MLGEETMPFGSGWGGPSPAVDESMGGISHQGQPTPGSGCLCCQVPNLQQPKQC